MGKRRKEVFAGAISNPQTPVAKKIKKKNHGGKSCIGKRRSSLRGDKRRKRGKGISIRQDGMGVHGGKRNTVIRKKDSDGGRGEKGLWESKGKPKESLTFTTEGQPSPGIVLRGFPERTLRDMGEALRESSREGEKGESSAAFRERTLFYQGIRKVKGGKGNVSKRRKEERVLVDPGVGGRSSTVRGGERREGDV